MMAEERKPDRAAMARRAARDIESGWYVNLGIGIPTMIADMIGDDREVVLHSENGILGMGPAPGAGEADPWLVNAGKQSVTLRPGASLFHHTDSFAMIRGGHLDLCVLGAYQVSASGDLANWTTPTGDTVPAVGGAMDLAVGARQVWILMEHTTREGEPKLVSQCTYPLTAPKAVSRVYTDLGAFAVTGEAFEILDLAEGIGFDEAQARTDAKLIVRR